VIIDSHCHAWAYWPYNPPVPDPETRGTASQLLHEMDRNGIDRALVVSAQIEHNPDNNAYVAEQVARQTGRLHQLVDLDSEWSPTYHTPGAAQRLRRMAWRWPICGFTHYLREGESAAWLYSADGLAMLRAAAELNLIVSLSATPDHQPSIRRAAQAFPSVPFLIHHMGYVRQGSGSLEDNVRHVLMSAHIPNIYIKLSGFAYTGAVEWDFPYKDVRWIVRALYEHFGPERMCWGSDYPVVRFFMTYRQSLEAFRTHCDFISPAGQEQILGRTLAGLLEGRGSPIAPL
jgi:predicted TIM-barrel fold metal-dependent hydrolase